MPSVYLLHRWTSDRERAPLRTTGRGSGRCLGAAAIASLVALIGAWLPWARVAGPVTGPPPSRAREALRGVDYSPALPSGEQSVNLIATPPTPVGFQFVDLAVILPVFAVLVGVGLALWRGRSSGVVFVLAGVAVFATGLVQFGEVAPLSDYAAGPGLALLGLSGIALVVSGLVLLWGSLDVLAWARERLDIERDERRVDSR